MKKFLLCFFIAVISFSLNAQDRLVYTSGKAINVVVVETSGSDLKFRMFDNPQGPILTEKLVNIYYVQYEDGQMQIFNNNPVRTNNYIPLPSSKPYTQPYSKPFTRPYVEHDFSPSSLTTQIDLYVQDKWGVGLMLRKELNEYVAWNIAGGSFMSGWKKEDGPNNFGIINARLCGIRLSLPCVDIIRAYAEVTPGYTHMYGNGQHINLFGFDFSAGFQIHKNVAIGYNLNFVVNGTGHSTTHWGRISLLF